MEKTKPTIKKLNLRKDLSEEEKNKVIFEISKTNIIQMMMQMMLNGTIEKYAYMYKAAIKEQGKPSGVYKHLDLECDKIVKLLKMKNKANIDYVLSGSYLYVFPKYWKDYSNEFDISQAYQRRFYEKNGELEETLYASVKDMLIENKMDKKAEALACVIVMEACANVGKIIVNESFAMMDAMAKESGISVIKQNSKTYERLLFAAKKVFEKEMKSELFHGKYAKDAEEASGNFQDAVVGKETIEIINEIIDNNICDYVDYCLARVSLEGMSDEIRNHMAGRTDTPLKIILKQLNAIKGDMDDVYDIQDAIRESQSPIIEELKKILVA